MARYDQALELWEGNGAAVSGGRRARLAYAKSALSVAFSPDGGSIASCGRDRTVKVWNVDGARREAVLEGHESEVESQRGPVVSLFWTADSTRVATAQNDYELDLYRSSYVGRIRLWSLEKGELSAEFESDRPVSVAMPATGDSRRLATAG